MSSREVRMALSEAAFAIVSEHFIGDIERIVFENDRFAVVAKRAGPPADVVTETDPRS